jgi:hypothetical protein
MSSGASGAGSGAAGSPAMSEAGRAATAGASGDPKPSNAGAPAPNQPDAGIDAGPPADAATAMNPVDYAKGLNELFIDVPCDPATKAPLAMMATCMHPPNTQKIEKEITFGGESSKMYNVTLRVRGVWEPTQIQGGEHPTGKPPLTVGGTIPPGSNSSDAVNYQQYSIRVSAPQQTYWLNDYDYVAHDIHKEDYQMMIRVTGGSKIVVTMNDGNDHEIANWTKDFFEGLAPYAMKPSLGQMVRLDVVSVTE